VGTPALLKPDKHDLNGRTFTRVLDKQGLNTRGGAADWTLGNETQVDTMRAGLAITQVETIRNRADNHRDRKCRETEDTRTSK